jgi:hypothetical protein
MDGLSMQQSSTNLWPVLLFSKYFCQNNWRFFTKNTVGLRKNILLAVKKMPFSAENCQNYISQHWPRLIALLIFFLIIASNNCCIFSYKQPQWNVFKLLQLTGLKLIWSDDQFVSSEINLHEVDWTRLCFWKLQK